MDFADSQMIYTMITGYFKGVSRRYKASQCALECFRTFNEVSEGF